MRKTDQVSPTLQAANLLTGADSAPVASLAAGAGSALATAVPSALVTAATVTEHNRGRARTKTGGMGTDGQRTDDDDWTDGRRDGRTEDDNVDDGTRRDGRTEDGRWDERTDRGRRRRRREGHDGTDGRYI